MCKRCGDPNCHADDPQYQGGKLLVADIEIDHHRENKPHATPAGCETCDVIATATHNGRGKFRVAVLALSDKGRATLAGLHPPTVVEQLAKVPTAPRVADPETWRTHRLLCKKKTLAPFLANLLMAHQVVLGLTGTADGKVHVIDPATGLGGLAALAASLRGEESPPPEPGEEWKEPKPAPVVEEILPPGFDRLLRRMRPPELPGNLN